LRDAEMQIDFSEVTGARDRVAVVATEPLTRDETWHEGTPGTMWVFNQGRLRATLPSLAQRTPATAAAAARSRKTAATATAARTGKTARRRG
jgi:glutamine amidotransferase